MSSGLGTLSVLFTDAVGSTALRARLGEDLADQLRKEHDALVHVAVAGCGGTVVKGLGDGIMATFGAAGDAVAAAVEIQQALEAHGRRRGPDAALPIRIGISVGDVSREEDDVHGTAVVEAARLCAHAQGGEIVVAQLIQMLARGRGGLRFEPMAPVAVKGLPDPVAASRVLWDPKPILSESRSGFPAPLATDHRMPFVGRDRLVADLLGAVSEVRAGSHRTFLLAGEPGVGKTRVAAHVAQVAHADGTRVLHGRCDDGLGVPYQPFVEALEHHLTASPDGPLGQWPQELSRLVPHLADEHGLGEPVRSDPRSEEHRLFSAVTSWLVEAAAEEGLVLVLDDLHWASPPTLRLMAHVLRHAPEHSGAGLLTIATYRDTDVEPGHPFLDVLGEVHRLPGVSRSNLGGLSEPEVLELLSAAAGHELDGPALALAATIHAETEGNPFFVGEVVRHLAETNVIRQDGDRWHVGGGAEVQVPESIRDVVTRRVTRLPEPVVSVLTTAAVIGRDVSVEVLSTATGRSEWEVIDALDHAQRARLVEESGADHYRFAHALVRTTLADQLSASRRRRLHQRVADAIARHDPDDVAGLAHHLVAAAGEAAHPDAAIQACLAAGQQALDRRAPGEAEHWFRQGLDLLEGHEARALDAARARLGLGVAQRDQGDPAHRNTLLDAGRCADALGDVETLVAAALANQRGWTSAVGGFDPDRIELAERALAVVSAAEAGGRHEADRVRLIALLASELVYAEEPERSRRLADEALRVIDTIDDAWTRAEVLTRLCFGSPHPDQPELDRDHARRAVASADESGDPTLQTMARVFLASAEMTLGHWTEVARWTEESLALASAASPTVAWSARFQHMKLVIGVRPSQEAAASNDSCLALGKALGEPDADLWWAAAMACIEYFASGGLGHLADLTLSLTGDYGGRDVVWHLAAALALAEAGRTIEARELLDGLELTPDRLADTPFPYQNLALAGTIAFVLEDDRLAEQVDAGLRGHEHRWPNFYLGTFGPAAYPLGLARSVLGRHEEASALLEDAAQATEDAGRIPNALRIRFDLARVLLRDGRPTAVVAALQQLDEVAAQAPVWGAHGLADEVRRLATRSSIAT